MTPLCAGDRKTIRKLLRGRHNHIVSTSPLWHQSPVQTVIKPLPDEETLKVREANFVNDAVRTELYCRARKLPIIPDFEATRDPHSRAYFRSPIVQSVMQMTLGESHKISRSNQTNRNKLSYRKRCLPTPRDETLREREADFINDAIITEKLRTKYKDIVPPYDASRDVHAQAYFCSYGVRDLMQTTMGGATHLPRLVSVRA